MKPHIQKGWLNEGDRRFGFIIEKRSGDKYPTIDVCLWWVWWMFFFSSGSK